MPSRVNPWLVLVLVCLAQFMVILDATIVNVALPTIQKDLDMTDTNLQWVVNAYTLLFGGFLLLGGRAGDLAGRKKIFLVGLVLFTSASLLCGHRDGVDLADRHPRPPGSRCRARLPGSALDRDGHVQGRC